MVFILYSEEIPLPTWTKLLFILVIAVFAPIILLQLLSGSIQPKLIIISFVFIGFLLAIYINFRELRVTISGEAVTVAFGLIKRRISIKDIQNCEVIRARLGVYGGNGIRFGGDGSLAFITNFGDAVKLSLGNARPFVFSTNNPPMIVNILKSLKANSCT